MTKLTSVRTDKDKPYLPQIIQYFYEYVKWREQKDIEGNVEVVSEHPLVLKLHEYTLEVVVRGTLFTYVSVAKNN